MFRINIFLCCLKFSLKLINYSRTYARKQKGLFIFSEARCIYCIQIVKCRKIVYVHVLVRRVHCLPRVRFVDNSPDVVAVVTLRAVASRARQNIRLYRQRLCAFSRPERTRLRMRTTARYCGTWQASRDAWRAVLLYGARDLTGVNDSDCFNVCRTTVWRVSWVKGQCPVMMLMMLTLLVTAAGSVSA